MKNAKNSPAAEVSTNRFSRSFSGTERSAAAPLSPVSNDLVNLAHDFADLSNRVGRDLSDGRLSAQEIGGLIFGGELVTIAAKLPGVARNWSRFSQDDRDAAVLEFAAYFDLTNDAAESKIETLVNSANTVYAVAEKLQKAYKSIWKAFKG